MREEDRVAALAVGAAATLAYGSLIERNAFTLRRFEVPVLAPGTPPIRLLHVSDLHITAAQSRKAAWIRQLAALEPDLVINTGDTLSAAGRHPDRHARARPAVPVSGRVRPGQQRLLPAAAEEPD